MGTTRRAFTKEFKQEAVRQVVGGGVPLSIVARDLQTTENVLRRWREQQQSHGDKAFPGNGVPVDQELALLRRENEKLKRQCEILKKATIFFAQNFPEQ